MAGIITLTTDFGDFGPFVGVMKGVILRHAPEVNIIDLTHRVAPFWCAEAGFCLSRSYRYFPAGTVHVAVVDPGVGTPRGILVASHDEHLFVAPDNGLLAMIPDLRNRGAIHRLSEDWRACQGWPQPSHTFHGRDIFAPLAAALATGRVRPSDIGAAVTDIAPAPIRDPVREEDGVHGQIVAVDTWGNLISNVDESLVKGIGKPVARIGGRLIHFGRTYGDAAPGRLVALINSFGVVEIACREGHAAAVLRARHGDALTVTGAV